MTGRRAFAAGLLCACLAAVGPAPAGAQDNGGIGAGEAAPDHRRTVTLDDVLHMETFGSAALSPDGRWVVYERRRPYDTSPRFDRAHRSAWVITDLLIAATDGTGVPEPLLEPEAGTGLLFGAWSPDGGRLLVYRLAGERFEAGTVRMADRSVHWTGLVPDLPLTGSGHDWLDPDRLALTVRTDGSLPWPLRFDTAGGEEMARRWTRTAQGHQTSRFSLETHGGRVETDAVPAPLAVVVLDEAQRTRTTVAEGAIRDITANPQGSWLAITRSGEPAGPDPSGVVIQSAIQRRIRLSLVETASGRSVEATAALDLAPGLLRWSPDGREVLFWGRRDGQSWSQARLAALSRDGSLRSFDTGDLRPLAEGFNIDELQAVQADWLGRNALFRGRRPGSARRDWWRVGEGAPLNLTASLEQPPSRLAAAGPGRVLAFADGRLWSMGEDEPIAALTLPGAGLTDGQTHTLMETPRPRLNSAPAQDWVVARSATDSRILSAAGETGLRTDAPPCPGTLLGRSATARAILTLCLDQGVETLRLATAEADRVLDRLNAGFAGLAVPRPAPLAHRDHLGRETTSFLFMPPGLMADEVRGVLVLVYPGVVDDGRYVEATGLGILGPRAQMLAAAGYAVLSAALPSEDDSTRSGMIDDFVRSTDLAVDAMLAAHPELPSDRMAVIGHSFGGYTALSIATRSDRFRSYISWAGVTDPTSKWGELTPHHRVWPADYATLDFAIGATEVGQTRLGGPPWADIAGYAAASPYLMADRIQAPLLLITADRDYVTQTQSELMLSAMHRQGKWARLVSYWGEGHSNASPANVRDAYREIFDWLEKTLGEPGVSASAAAVPRPGPSPRSPPSP